jgi:hypothetical protein
MPTLLGEDKAFLCFPRVCIRGLMGLAHVTNEKGTMRDEKRSPLVTGVLILNSLLLGVMVIALFISLAAVSLIVDQEIGGWRGVTEYTQWVFDHTPRHPFSMISISVAVTVTSLFFSLAFPSDNERGERTRNHLLFIATFCLIAAIYFFVSIAGILTSLVVVYGDLTGAGQTPPVHAHSSMHLNVYFMSSPFWLFAAGAYSLALLIIGIRLRCKK